ncbi:MAG: ABC transporter permease subunit [Coriobacteriia bacterium]|nr:ABC transporter permease subunit [Coriobacteriia bacterium]
MKDTAAIPGMRMKGNKIQIRTPESTNKALNITLFVLAALTIFTFVQMDYRNLDFLEASYFALRDFGMMMFSPSLKAGHFGWDTIVYETFKTIGLAILSTVFSAIISFFLGLAGALNFSNKTLSTLCKSLMSLIRAIPTILWVLVFTVAIGLGSEAAIVGISFHSIAYLTKAFSESFEEIDEGTIEALKASGASYWQIVFQCALPETISKLLSWTFIRFEINFTNAVAVGAVAGAGGIGYQLFQAGSFYYSIQEVGVIVYACLIVAFMLEFISIQLRKRYIVQ